MFLRRQRHDFLRARDFSTQETGKKARRITPWPPFSENTRPLERGNKKKPVETRPNSGLQISSSSIGNACGQDMGHMMFEDGDRSRKHL